MCALEGVRGMQRRCGKAANVGWEKPMRLPQDGEDSPACVELEKRDKIPRQPPSPLATHLTGQITVVGI